MSPAVPAIAALPNLPPPYQNYGVYGIPKMHAQLAREGVLGASGQRPVARCTTSD